MLGGVRCQQVGFNPLGKEIRVSDESFSVPSAEHLNFLLALRKSSLATGGHLTSQEDLRSSISSGYREQAKIASSSSYPQAMMWNWGLRDSAVEQELFRRGVRLGAETDGFCEQMYYFALQQLPNHPDYTDKCVIEVGCGSGAGLHWVSQLVDPSCRLIGIDLSKNAIELANATYGNCPQVQFIDGDAENMPLEDETVDIVINIESAHNYPNLRKFFREVARVLNPGGYLTCTDAFTPRRRAAFALARPESLGLEWVNEIDISDRVRASIRNRMAPDSKFRVTSGIGVPSPVDSEWGDYFAGMSNGKYVGRENVRPSQKFPAESYRHFLARKCE